MASIDFGASLRGLLANLGITSIASGWALRWKRISFGSTRSDFGPALLRLRVRHAGLEPWRPFAHRCSKIRFDVIGSEACGQRMVELSSTVRTDGH